jgi:preprotein translocase subunit SecG
VEDKDSRVTGSTDPVVIWTVVLVIVFVVLLIILIVLLTKRPTETEEFGETSYY